MKLIDAKCPNCKAMLKLDNSKEKVECEYCHHTILVEDAVATFKLKVSGSVSVDGIETNSDLIDAANELLDMGEYLKAKKKFLEFSEKCPEKYQGWLGLLICRTRNFTIRDNNILFENDIKKYYEHFLRTASQDVKDTYLETIEDYMFPGRVKEEEKEEIKEEVKEEEVKKDNKNDNNTSTAKPAKNVFNYIVTAFSAVFFLSCLTSGKVLPILLWLLMFLMFLPPLNNYLCSKLEFIKKGNVVIKVILSVAAILSLGTIPYAFDGTWLDDNDMFVDFSSGKCYIGTYKKENGNIVYNETYNNKYEHNSEGDFYYINCGSEYSFRYTKGSLCLLENGECARGFTKVDADN